MSDRKYDDDDADGVDDADIFLGLDGELRKDILISEAILRISALEQVLIDKKIITEEELNQKIAELVREFAQTVRGDLSKVIKQDIIKTLDDTVTPADKKPN